jgi:hypothetical protein
MTKQFRLEKYLGALSNADNHMLELNEYNISFNTTNTIQAFPDRRLVDEFLSHCPYDMEEYFGLCEFGIVKLNHGFYRFTKSRPFNRREANNNVISFTSTDRHWDPVRDILSGKIKDIEWSEKQDKVVWRGSLTNIFAKANPRLLAVKKYKSHKDFDVGFTEKRWVGVASKDLIKPAMSIDEMLTYKYIISIEGDDIATNLQWAMCSNSLTIMPVPTREGWFLESCLVPWVHFVPINETMDDLEEKLEWCRNNDEQCQEIVKAANEYVSSFLNFEEERELASLVIKNYFDRLTFVCNESLRKQYPRLVQNKKNILFT